MRTPRNSNTPFAVELGTAAFQPPKEWTAGKPSFRFMGSLHFILTRIGTMNQTARDVSRQRLGVRQSSAAFVASGGAESARGLAQSKTWRCYERFMESISTEGQDTDWSSHVE